MHVCRYEAGDFWILYNDVRSGAESDSCYWELENLNRQNTIRLAFGCADLFRPYVVEYFVDDTSIVLVDLLNVIVFRKRTNEYWAVKRIIPLPATAYRCLRASDSTLHIFTDVCSSNKAEHSCFYSYTVNVGTGRCGPIHEFEAPEGAALMFSQPRNVFARHGGTLVFADILQYSLRFLDAETFETRDSIAHSPEHWHTAGMDIDIPEDAPVQAYFPLIDSLQRNCSSIRRVTLLAEDSLLVMWNSPDANAHSVRATLDLWCKTATGWQLPVRQTNNMVQNADMPAYSLKNKILSSTYVYDNGYFLELIVAPPPGSLYKEWPSFAAYQAACDAHYLENPLEYLLLVRRIQHD